MSIASALVSISFIFLHFVGVPHLLPNLLEASHARRNLRRVRDETSRGFHRAIAGTRDAEALLWRWLLMREGL